MGARLDGEWYLETNGSLKLLSRFRNLGSLWNESRCFFRLGVPFVVVFFFWGGGGGWVGGGWGEIRGSNYTRKSSLGNTFQFLTKEIFLGAIQQKMIRFSLKCGDCVNHFKYPLLEF